MADEVASNKDEPSAKTLSRSSLYAPLTAYASGALQTPQKVAKSHAESSLVEWLQRWSADYHQSCKPGDPRNTGNQFLSKFDIQEKIMHRTLSLFGKDYTAKVGHHTKAIAKRGKSVKHKRHKRTSKNTGQGCGPLSELDDARAAKVTRILYSCADSIEWVGSNVIIESCSASQNWQGRSGTLVSTTQNTWVVVETKIESGNATKLTIPKKGSSLKVMLRLDKEDQAHTQSMDKANDYSTLRIRLKGDSMPV
eukprot:scaffold2072_cov162-Amphora_coffeaeformis.AAC.4